MKKHLLLITILLIIISSCQSLTPNSPTTSPPTEQPTSTIEPFNPSLTVIGQPEVVYKWDTDRCADNMLPDLPTRAIRDADGNVQLIISSTTNYRLIGPDFDSLKPDCSPIMLSDQDPNPANYNHSEWLAATYTEDGKTIYAIVHNEFHGDQVTPSQCPSGLHVLCTLISLTSALSTDGGKTYTQLPAPNHRVANFPYPYDPDWMRAIWQPSGIVKSPKDGYYYVLIQYDQRNSDHTSDIQGMCVMRTQTLDDPSSWRAWDGTGFNMRFINPYLETDADPKEHDCKLVTPENSALSYGLTYNTYLDKFVATGVSGGARPGFYYSLSDDLIHWTPKEFFMDATMGFLNGSRPPFDAYPTLIDHTSPSMSFDVTGQYAYLYYTIVTNNSPWTMDLMRVRVGFSRNADDLPLEATAAPESTEKEPIDINVSQTERIVPANTPVNLFLGWGAKTGDLVAEFISAAQFEITLDGTPLPEATNPWSPIELSGNGKYESRWSFSLGILQPGQHTVQINITLKNPVSDGLGYNYSDTLLNSTMKIIVEQ